MRRLLSLSLLLPLYACAGQVVGGEMFDHAQSGALILEGDDLARELGDSPVHSAATPFRRLGLLYDALPGGVVEVQTSVDGATWSAWRAAEVLDVESEEADAFVATVDVDGEAARYYRLRAAVAAASFLSLETLDDLQAASVEAGDPVDESAGEVGVERAALTVGGVAVNDRSTWGARAARCSSSHKPVRLAIHHTVTPTNDSISAQARLRQIQSYHQDVQGWCDIGYHFLVSRDGRLWEGRPANRLGTHVLNNNTGNVGISFMGTHTSTPASATQIDKVGQLVKGVGATYGIAISSSTVKGHRTYTPGHTSCPGDALFGQIGGIIARARQSTQPPPPPPATGTGTLKGVVYRGSNSANRVAGATVKVGDKTLTADASGYYEVVLPVGSYTITASAPGLPARSVTRAVQKGGVTWGSVSL
jgi:hypothetical protein